MTPQATPILDPHDVQLVSDGPEVLLAYNRAGVLGAADVHAAATLCNLAADDRPEVLLAAALAVRAPRFGHVCVELSRVRDTVTGTEEAPVRLDELDWPDHEAWREALSDSPLVAIRPSGTPAELDPSQDRPLSLVGDRLYLDRYWRYERRVAEVLRRRAERLHDHVDPAAIRPVLDRLLPPGDERPDRQRLAVASGALRGLTVIAGGPGTGKTFTVARLLALVQELAGSRRPRIAVTAPTGKAADRLAVALRDAATELDTSQEVRRRLRSLEASTIHRLLGWNPASATRFRYGRDHQLPHQLVVVDETSMVDLPLMAKLLVALRPDAGLVLVGDPDQLASVEAGAVLSDIVGPSGVDLRMDRGTRGVLEIATGEPLDEIGPAREVGIDDAIVVLGRVRRYQPGSGIAQLATAIHAADPDTALDVLASGPDDVMWVACDGVAADRDEFIPIRERLVEAFGDVYAAATRGHADVALRALGRVRVLCAHRRGPVGVSRWQPLIERWLADAVPGFEPNDRWHVGRPVLVTNNEPRLHLFNGDVGVVVAQQGGVAVAFEGADGVRLFGPSRLEQVETVHAMTIHKSQGSEFDHVVVVLPDADSPILTRELLYTAITRARHRLTVVGTEVVIRAAIQRPVARAAGLREALWGP